MRVGFSTRGWEDYRHWQARKAEGDDTLDRVNALIEEARRSPFAGQGKPEPLKNELRGWWSRRITREHRLVYQVRGTDREQTLWIAQCRYHYGR